MSAVKHTPGPWRVASPSLYAGSEINIDAGERGYIACCGHRGDEEAEANALRIVRCVNAHDELVAAAKRALAVLKAQGESVRRGNVLDALENAIAKAGGTPS